MDNTVPVFVYYHPHRTLLYTAYVIYKLHHVYMCFPPLSETSELVYCVADLQMSNQKLQEEVRKMKQVVEGMEESNQKLAEENEDLRNQARV